jgi:hypothetical protein
VTIIVFMYVMPTGIAGAVRLARAKLRRKKRQGETTAA